MELIGEAGGQPYMSGVPLCDLKAGDEVYANVALALERDDLGGDVLGRLQRLLDEYRRNS